MINQNEAALHAHPQIGSIRVVEGYVLFSAPPDANNCQLIHSFRLHGLPQRITLQLDAAEQVKFVVPNGPQRHLYSLIQQKKISHEH